MFVTLSVAVNRDESGLFMGPDGSPNGDDIPIPAYLSVWYDEDTQLMNFSVGVTPESRQVIEFCAQANQLKDLKQYLEMHPGLQS